MKKFIYAILSLIFVFTSIYSIYQIYHILNQNHVEKAQNEYLNDIAMKPLSKPQQERNPYDIEIDFDALQNKNEEIIAWIKIPDTDIDHAIVQGSDNDYYLHHNALKEENYAGAVFVDYRNAKPFEEEHTIIYAHNVKHGTMFASLELFGDETFYKKHPIYYLYTPKGNYEVEIFAFYTTTSTSDAYELYDINHYVSKWQENSQFQSQVQLTEDDYIVTLSTCSYERNNQPSELRHVLKGVLKKLSK
jgi:sortase B